MNIVYGHIPKTQMQNPCMIFSTEQNLHPNCKIIHMQWIYTNLLTTYEQNQIIHRVEE